MITIDRLLYQVCWGPNLKLEVILAPRLFGIR